MSQLVAMPNERTPVDLPAWAQVSDKRRGHIQRVTDLLDRWADRMQLARDEAAAWHDAGRWHDALRDAPASALGALIGEEWRDRPERAWHGPAAAATLRHTGEARADVLDAITWHTLGHADWSRTGRALYMADFLEPGRPFAARDRAFLATLVPTDFDGTFRQVVRWRVEWTVREGNALFPETVQLWNRVR
jgi:2-amino-4-hydroxy-6-hydroxymethyldihydropteridine diphosphokinase